MPAKSIIIVETSGTVGTQNSQLTPQNYVQSTFLNKVSDYFRALMGGSKNATISYGSVSQSADSEAATTFGTFSGTPLENDTITINGTALTFVDPFASLEIQDLTYTAVEEGTSGNSISIEYLEVGNNTPLSVDVAAELISVNLETDGLGAAISTADEVLAAIEASTAASALVTVAVTGTGSNVQAAAAEDNLTGGSAVANNEISLGGSPSAATLALRTVAAINDSTTAALSGVVNASASTVEVHVFCNMPGLIGNNVAVSESATGFAWDNATLEGGVGTFPVLTKVGVGRAV